MLILLFINFRFGCLGLKVSCIAYWITVLDAGFQEKLSIFSIQFTINMLLFPDPSQTAFCFF